MLEQLQTFLSPSGFIPHGHCYLWKSPLVWLHLVSDSIIALSYFSIPITLLYFTTKRKDIPFNWIFCMFGAFILACGVGHVMDVWTLWHPNYWTSGLIKALTALISVITALELIPLVPKALALPKPAELAASNQELEATLRQLQQAQIQLIQTEKMSSLGQLVAGIAHEINNPINFIHGNLTHATEYIQELVGLLQLYQKTYPEPEPELQAALEESEAEFILEDLPKLVTSMQVGSLRIRQLVLSLRNFSRLDEADMKPVNLHEGIDSTLLILQNRLQPKVGHPSISLIKEYGTLPLVECYAGQINQVFMNIIANAIDVLEAEGIRTSTADETKACYLPCIKIRTSLCDSNWVMIEISDNGVGMSEAVKQQIFNPFFTTKSIGKGTGLGLSISYQIIVEKHGGSLECMSTPEQGTTFQIRIPTQQPRSHLASGRVMTQLTP
ncbi:MAG TPA: HAMP domain-containing histidine kinase [Leptolyngbyaceae cyanobacterium M33_DOE_097]|uniref:histidine kinase n=1 Tax=Oscillatoriales cyanobacterium SpSt-418 TaxID=2282169 RepID=A0A7C3PBQ6_9CYAN|nr:HAMP domain-containing histidine kinase [Leptolyngbyaceae cyanobacterium M33_DOE_097]